MYSTLAMRENSKISGRIVGTHQKLDRIARKLLTAHLPQNVNFPEIKDILYFEGSRGPDGLKRKSPGKDEPMHFIIPGSDDKTLITLIQNHHYNLAEALKNKNETRAAFEAAWLAHAITDGLTPAHHFPLQETQAELMTEKEFIKVFGVPIKGIMHGRDAMETLKNNWKYWGVNGHMSKHIAFEYGAAITLTALPPRAVSPKLAESDFKNINLEKEFYRSLEKVAALDLYNDFRKNAWTPELVTELKRTVFPEIVRVITLAWASAAAKATKTASSPVPLAWASAAEIAVEKAKKAEKSVKSEKPVRKRKEQNVK